ncbi:MAG: hypothetical protein Q7V62_11955 [Actinomycetota bacterium]|nr:hypothetical protein [Actinomycetota bacterium]
MKDAEMFQNPYFLSTMAFQRHAEFQAQAARRHRLFRRPLSTVAPRSARVFDLPMAAAAAHGCDTRVA